MFNHLVVFTGRSIKRLVYISSHWAAKRASQRKGKPAKDLLELEEEMLVQDPDIHLEEEAPAEAESPGWLTRIRVPFTWSILIDCCKTVLGSAVGTEHYAE